jgi:phosphoribosyl 1,2-cyclic phosphate phosphodiesterase
VGALVETDGGTRLLIDTPPELRLQLIANNVDRVDAVLFTHDHADHTHGLDDIRAITNHRAGPLTMYGASDTLERLGQRFSYIFDDTMRVLPGTTKPEGRLEPLLPGVTVRIGDAEVTPVIVPHGRVTVFAYRIGDLAYVTDAKSIPSEATAVLRGAKVLVINALFRTGHPSHLSLPEAIAAAREIGAERTYLTHLTHDNFHADLEAELPRDIQPAFDGLTVQL